MIHNLLLENKNEYSAKTVLMATKNQINGFQLILLILEGWYKEVSAINLRKQCEVVKKSEYFTFGIMVDESIRELKNLNQCTGAVVSQIVTESCKQHNLDSYTCQT
ncbi:unnamed protein product [Rhizophagus irregularis]|uniref:Uncharacterized protein n=1 Tax=Rhizophagus irregularis TaxID=588596 RepID=A0A2I1ENY9_9GLOM|nr:hypothetical protein RhiirB3_438169 [Rhizophagus irregularis]CAB5373793.1 unnamed protein product [Rhizophagus irregularis]